jgi:hypothetical protein
MTPHWVAYDEGWDSLKDGSSNPYPAGSELANEWEIGRAEAKESETV